MVVNYDKEFDVKELMTDEGWVGEIAYSTEYAMYVEYDTAYAGSKPPFTPIHEWVQRKWDDISPEVKEVAEHENQTVSEHQEAVAWVIVNSIADSGTDGVHFGKRSLEKAQQEGDRIARKHRGKANAPEKIARDLTHLMFQYSQDIIAGDPTEEDDDPEAFDKGTLHNSGSFEVREVNPDDDS